MFNSPGTPTASSRTPAAGVTAPASPTKQARILRPSADEQAAIRRRSSGAQVQASPPRTHSADAAIRASIAALDELDPNDILTGWRYQHDIESASTQIVKRIDLLTFNGHSDNANKAILFAELAIKLNSIEVHGKPAEFAQRFAREQVNPKIEQIPQHLRLTVPARHQTTSQGADAETKV
jgi:hypothetical protein